MLQLLLWALAFPGAAALAVVGPLAPAGLAVLLLTVAYMGHPVVAASVAAALLCAALAALYYARRRRQAVPPIVARVKRS
jgi:uncharacterized membrane protein YjjB (DUF3815 family)